MAGGDATGLAPLWRECFLNMNGELHTAAEAAARKTEREIADRAKKAEQEIADRAKKAKQLGKLKALVREASEKAQLGLDGNYPSLHAIRAVVHSRQKPANANHAAVWEEFQWMKVLFAALRGGAAEFNAWLEIQATVGTDSPCKSMQDRLDDEYHSIQRARSMPGEFVGGRLQHRSSDGSWQDIADGVSPVGPCRVLARYEVHDGDQAPCLTDYFVCLLVKLPVVPVKISVDHEKDKVSHYPLMLPGAVGTQPQAVQLDGKNVHCMHIALTLPRLHLLQRMQYMFTWETQGMMLHGVHGAGKSSTLKALVSILSVGGGTNVLYAPKSSELAMLNSDALLKSSVHGGGVLSKQLLSGEYVPDETKSAWYNSHDSEFSFMWRALLKHSDSNAPGRNAPGSDTSKPIPDPRVLRAVAVLSQMSSSPIVPGLQVVIFDEVNQLLEAVQYHAKIAEVKPPDRVDMSFFTACRNYWREWLPWKSYGNDQSFRILASSPHGRREDNERLPGLVEFELRPAPADHLAAVLQCAPEYLGGVPFSDVAGARCRLSAEESLVVCETLGGNARFISTFLRNSEELPKRLASQGSRQELFEELSEACFEEVCSLSERFSAGLPDKFGELPAAVGAAAAGAGTYGPTDVRITDGNESLFRLASHDASLVVRHSATVGSPPTVLAGAPALQAIMHTLGKNTTLGLAWLQGISVRNFEASMTVAMSMGAAARQMWPLTLLQKTEEAKGLRSAHHAVHGDAGHGVFDWPVAASDANSANAGSKGVHGTVASDGAARVTVLSGLVVLPVKTLTAHDVTKRPMRIVFQTVSNFPGIDAVCIELLGSVVHVTFWEMTVSTLVKHATDRKPVPASQCSVECGVEHGNVQVDTALRDVLAIMGVSNTVCSKHESAVQLASAGTKTAASMASKVGAYSITEPTSTVNCLLATLGVPLVVSCQLSEKQESQPVGSSAGEPPAQRSTRSSKKAAAKQQGAPAAQTSTASAAVPCTMSLRLEQSGELCDQLHGKGEWEVPGVTHWSFRMVYATCTRLEDNLSDHYAGLNVERESGTGGAGQASPSSASADFVCGVFSEDLCF